MKHRMQVFGSDAAPGGRALRRLTLGDPEQFARSLSGHAHWFWLDGTRPELEGSAEPSADDDGWSYLGVADTVHVAERGREAEFLRLLRDESRQLREQKSSDSLLETPVAPGAGLHSGWILALSYEFGVAQLGIRPAVDNAAPAFALRVDVVLAVHMRLRRAEIRGSSAAAINAWMRVHTTALTAAGFIARTATQEASHLSAVQRCAADRASGSDILSSQQQLRAGSQPLWNARDEQYAARVAACRSAIANGDAYVLCLTDTAQVTANSSLPDATLTLFECLRAAGGGLRSGVLVSGGRSLVSISPERFLRVTGSKLEAFPMKGTRRRGKTRHADARLREELLTDPKERAENVMIVDVMRNDFSRVCTAESVRVPVFLRVESHPHVLQLVSTVSGELLPDNDVYDAIHACFPGASMTGAPKYHAVELLASYENASRGLYSGCFGWIDDSGDAELAMTIRSIELRDESASLEDSQLAVRIGAGGGITADSDPEQEVAEKHLKAAPLFVAFRRVAG